MIILYYTKKTMLHGTSSFRVGKEAFFVLARKELALLRDKLRTSSPAEGRGCAEAYIRTAELALSLPNGRSVEILPVPRPKSRRSARRGGPTAPGR